MYNVSLHNIWVEELGDIRSCQHQQPRSIHKHIHSDKFCITCLVTEVTIKGATIQKLGNWRDNFYVFLV